MGTDSVRANEFGDGFLYRKVGIVRQLYIKKEFGICGSRFLSGEVMYFGHQLTQ